MEKETRNKLLLGVAIVLTLGVAWYGWKYWGWFGGTDGGMVPPPKKQCEFETEGRKYQLKKIMPSKDGNGIYVGQYIAVEPTPQGVPAKIELAFEGDDYERLKKCPGVLVAAYAGETIEDSERSFAVGGKVSISNPKGGGITPPSNFILCSKEVWDDLTDKIHFNFQVWVNPANNPNGCENQPILQAMNAIKSHVQKNQGTWNISQLNQQLQWFQNYFSKTYPSLALGMSWHKI